MQFWKQKRFWVPVSVISVLLVTYLLGPRLPEPVYGTALPELPRDLRELDSQITLQERKLPVRRDNQARILWARPYQRTEYSIVYLHGFSGSYRDGYPVNVQLADTLDANLYLSRWAGHGLMPGDALEEFSPENAWESAKEALVIGNLIGRKVIILSTSTGGTLALKLAAVYPEKVFALINMSPNIEDDNDAAWVLDSPWGHELARLVSLGSERKIEHQQPLASQYWDTVYPAEALVDLQILLETTMNPSTLKQIVAPTLTLFYRENFLEEDDHVEVEVYPAVHQLLSTPKAQKSLVRLETPKTHFIGSGIKSEDTTVVLQTILDFLEEVLKLNLQRG